MQYDTLIVGAGFAGAVTARRLAEAGRRVLVLEKHDHIGGNAYDRPDAAGVLIHQYGPHIFHTNDKEVYDFLSRFTKWRDYQHTVAANIPAADGGRTEMPVPFNLVSLRLAFGPEKAAELEQKLLDTYGAGTKVTILQLRQNTDPDLKALAQYVYDHVFVRYTMKQWGKTPEEIDPAVTARVPVFLSEDCRYFQDAYQGMPLEGYTVLFENMLRHENITLRTGFDARERLRFEDAHAGGQIYFDNAPFDGDVIYSGPADELFGCCFGRLPYRTLDFKFETYPQDVWQSHGTVNYTMDEDYTRITEFKYLTGQVLPGATTIVKEYSRAYTGAEDEIPYYAIANDDTAALYARYAEKAAHFPRLHLLGRLAEYRYYNMDAIVAGALRLSDALVKQ